MMLSRFVPTTIALLLTAVSPSTRAFFDPPWTVPAAPHADEVVSVSIHGGVCDAIFFRPGYPQIIQNGNSVRIVEYGDHLTPGDELCIYGIGTLTEPIGTFSPGAYTLTVDLVYDNYPFGYETITIGVVPFTVSGATSAMPIPVFSPICKFVLLLLISGIAGKELKHGDEAAYVL
jgi:hypothetical protein